MHNIPLILGLGKTGFSVAHYFKRKKIDFRVIDTRLHPPQLDEFRHHFSDIPIHLGNLHSTWFKETNKIIVSPGLDWNEIMEQTKCPANILFSDIDLFNEEAKAPIIGITGSNGKSTTSALAIHLLKDLHKTVYIGGNFGIPALDLLTRPIPDFYILELSSFQLTLIQHLKLYIGVFLNLNENHIDRHGTLEHYHAMKQNIYRDCKIAIWNRDDVATAPICKIDAQVTFGRAAPVVQEQWGIIKNNHTAWLAKGNQKLLDVRSLPIQGTFNALNTLAALAITHILSAPLPRMLTACLSFRSLPHRCEKIIERNSILWINDSKSTNVDATIAAIESLLPLQMQGKLILILGGVNKNKNIKLLKVWIKQYVKHVILIGKSAIEFKEILQGSVAITQANDLRETVQIASSYAKANDIVLLSPACASFDMFRDYIERGEQFKREVQILFNQTNI